MHTHIVYTCVHTHIHGTHTKPPSLSHFLSLFLSFCYSPPFLPLLQFDNYLECSSPTFATSFSLMKFTLLFFLFSPSTSNSPSNVSTPFSHPLFSSCLLSVYFLFPLLILHIALPHPLTCSSPIVLLPHCHHHHCSHFNYLDFSIFFIYYKQNGLLLPPSHFLQQMCHSHITHLLYKMSHHHYLQYSLFLLILSLISSHCLISLWC